MQIPMKDNTGSRVDFYGNARDGVFIEIVDERGITRKSRQLTDVERLNLIAKLQSTDNGRAV